MLPVLPQFLPAVWARAAPAAACSPLPCVTWSCIRWLVEVRDLHRWVASLSLSPARSRGSAPCGVWVAHAWQQAGDFLAQDGGSFFGRLPKGMIFTCPRPREREVVQKP